MDKCEWDWTLRVLICKIYPNRASPFRVSTTTSYNFHYPILGKKVKIAQLSIFFFIWVTTQASWNSEFQNCENWNFIGSTLEVLNFRDFHTKIKHYSHIFLMHYKLTGIIGIVPTFQVDTFNHS